MINNQRSRRHRQRRYRRRRRRRRRRQRRSINLSSKERKVNTLDSVPETEL